MGMGLGFATGVADAGQTLQQILAERLAKQQYDQQYADKMKQQTFENEQSTHKLAQQDTLTRLGIQEKADAAAGTQQDRAIGIAKGLGDQIPDGTKLPPTDPAVGMLRTGGLGSLLQHQDPTLPSTQTAAFGLPGAKPIGSLRTVSNAGNPEQYLKLPSEKQQQDAALNTDRTAKNADSAARLDETQRYHDLLNSVAEGRLSNEQLRVELARQSADAKANKGINLSQAGKSARAAIEQAAPLTDQVIAMIQKEAPDIEANPGKYNGLMAKATALGQTLKYKAGFYDETDPRQQIVSLLQPIQAGQYTRSSRSQRMLELALKHMADPSQTLATQYQRAKELKSIMPEMLQGIVRAEQPVDPSNPLGGSYFDPKKGGAAPAADPLGIR